MHPFRRILIPTDFSVCAEAAFQHGLYLARQYGAEVHVLHVAEEAKMGDGRLVRQLESWPHRITKHEGENAAEKQSEIKRVLLHDPSPATGILTYVQDHSIDLIVLGTYGDDGVKRFLNWGDTGKLLGVTAEQIARHAPCPVFRVMLRRGRTPELVNHILVPVDDTSLSRLSIQVAAELAKFYHADLVLLHVIEPSSPHYTNGSSSLVEIEAALVQGRSLLERALETCNVTDLSVGLHVIQGKPSREIRTFVEQHGIDLVVLGAHSDLGPELLGEVTGQVFHRVPCPIFITRDRSGAPTEKVQHA